MDLARRCFPGAITAPAGLDAATPPVFITGAAAVRPVSGCCFAVVPSRTVRRRTVHSDRQLASALGLGCLEPFLQSCLCLCLDYRLDDPSLSTDSGRGNARMRSRSTCRGTAAASSLTKREQEHKTAGNQSSPPTSELLMSPPNPSCCAPWNAVQSNYAAFSGA